MRGKLLQLAREKVEESGPEALRARSLTAQAGTSTQSLYTLFGGMPGLFDALVADGFDEFARYVAAVEETEDPVADFFAKGWTYGEWALAHPHLYRLMFGLSGGDLRHHAGLEVALAGSIANTPQAQRSVDVLVNAMRRVTESGRLDPIDPVISASQFLSATHGFVLLQAGGVFGPDEGSTSLIGGFGVNLMVGMGDDRERATESLQKAIESISVS
ncbi:MAG: TetR-like C-terminal domain-containing protein [Solirubrobacterales bacterium]